MAASKVWTSNSNLLYVGRWYFDHIYETRRLPKYIRMDKGAETGVMGAIHALFTPVAAFTPPAAHCRQISGEY